MNAKDFKAILLKFKDFINSTDEITIDVDNINDYNEIIELIDFITVNAECIDGIEFNLTKKVCAEYITQDIIEITYCDFCERFELEEDTWIDDKYHKAFLNILRDTFEIVLSNTEELENYISCDISEEELEYCIKHIKPVTNIDEIKRILEISIIDPE